MRLLKKREVYKLLNFSDNYEVCNCKRVSLLEIKNLVLENKVRTLRDLQEQTAAGTECRHCLMKEADFGMLKKEIYCQDILKEFLDG